MSPPDRRTISRETVSDRRARIRQLAADRQVEALKARYAANRTLVERVADRLTRIAASPPFLIVHALWFGGWIALNTGLVGTEPFDPFPFGLLTMVVSLEAIFLSIFVLMTQNREASIAELREEMTLEVDLRMEEEVTKTLQLVVGLYGRLGFSVADDDDLRSMLQPLDMKRIEHELALQIQRAEHARARREQDPPAP